MEYGLTGISLAVEHKAGPAFFETEVFRDELCAVKHLAHEFAIFRLHVHDGCDVALRHDQEVYWCLRGDVVEGEHVVVFVDFLGRDFTLDDFTEKAIFTHSIYNSSKKILGILARGVVGCVGRWGVGFRRGKECAGVCGDGAYDFDVASEMEYAGKYAGKPYDWNPLFENADRQ